jgi:hypothetical protein
MPLELKKSTPPVEVETLGQGLDYIKIGDYQIDQDDFFRLVHFIMTNTNLSGPDDPRLHFVQCMRSMDIGEGTPNIAMGALIKTQRLTSNIAPVKP